MDTVTRHLRRALGNTALVAVMAAAGLAIALTAVFWALHQTKTFGPNWAFNVPVATPLDQRPDLNPTTPGTEVQFSEVLVIPGVDLTDAMLLDSMADSSRYLVALLALVVVEVLCWRLLRDRPFSRIAAWSLGVLAVLMSLVAVLAPYLESVAVQRAVDAMGLPTDGEAATTWVVPVVHTWEDTDWSLLALGLVCGLCAILLARGTRLQRDTEGLI